MGVSLSARVQQEVREITKVLGIPFRQYVHEAVIKQLIEDRRALNNEFNWDNFYASRKGVE